jgi:hypothetical protein
MNKPIHDSQINKVLLKPRFNFEVDKNKDKVISALKKKLNEESCEFSGKIIDNHIVVDVSKKNEHYWSPQLHVEVISEDNKTMVKGLLSPKPKVWTFFMFLHFAVAITFFVFLVMFYTQYNLNQDYKFSMIMCIIMPITWIILYFVGQFGKKLGYNQMVELHDFLIGSLETIKR